MLLGARFPGRYVQGPEALARLGEEAARFGSALAAVVDGGIFEPLGPAIERACRGRVALTLLRHGGECSEAEIARVRAAAEAAGANVIAGAGGGKALDTAKAVADDLKLPCIIIPTIAASDAPCSSLAIVYREDGTVAYDRFLLRNPDLVLVDTAVIARAPARFLAAGIGDALSTYYEADACRRSGARNCLQLRGPLVAHEIARLCRDVILGDGVAALADCDRQEPGEALERVVEANILLSGVGFESGGVAAAHAVHHGLCDIPEVHHFLHGEKVAIGVLVELKLQGREAEFAKIRDYCRSVRLPVRLADVGIREVTEEKLARIAARACRPGEIVHNEPYPVTEQAVVAALRALV